MLYAIEQLLPSTLRSPVLVVPLLVGIISLACLGCLAWRRLQRCYRQSHAPKGGYFHLSSVDDMAMHANGRAKTPDIDTGSEISQTISGCGSRFRSESPVSAFVPVEALPPRGTPPPLRAQTSAEIIQAALPGPPRPQSSAEIIQAALPGPPRPQSSA